MDIERIINVYVKIRDARDAAKRAFVAEDTDLKSKMERLEQAMLLFLQENKTESMRTASGTVYKQEEIMPRGDDWEVFYNWVKQHDAFDALERRIKRKFVADYMADHDGTPPPGVSVMREYVARIRRA